MKNKTIRIKSILTRLLALAGVLAIASASAATFTWSNTAGGSWATQGNWSAGTLPTTTGDTADFSTLDITAATTVTLDANQFANKIIFGDTVTNTAFGWVVSAGTPSTSLLYVGGANPTIAVNALGGASIANITAPILATNLTVVGPGILNMGSFSSVISGLIITNGATFEFGSGAGFNFGPLTFSGNGTLSSGMSSSYTPSFTCLTNAPGVSSTLNFGSRFVIGPNAATPPNNIAGTLTINVGASVGGSPTSRAYLQGVWENTSGSPCTINLVGTSTTSYLQCYCNGGGFNSQLTNATFNFYSSSAGVNKITCGGNNNSGGNTFNMGALTGTSDATLSSDGTGAGMIYSVGMLGTSTTFGGKFSGDCSLTKVGAGTLTLTNNSTIGANSANAVNVNAGKLVGMTGGSFLAPAFNVAAGATLGVQIASAGGQWVTTNLVFATGTNYLEFNFGTTAASTTVAPLLTTNFTINSSASNVVNVLGGVWTPGTYPLVKYSGTFAGSGGFAVMRLGTLPLRVVATLNNNTANHSIDLVVSAVNEPLKWATTSGTWDIATTANWKDAAANTVTYQEQLGLGDQVVLEDNVSGAGPITVTLNSTVTPTGLTVTNSTKNYTISGTGVIQGAIALNKSGTGTLTVTTTNTFTGAANLNGGILKFNNLGALGAGTAINFGGGALQYAAGNTTDISTRTVTINAGGATIDTAANSVSFAKRIGNSGTGGLTKAGSGSLTLNTNSTYSGATFVSQGSLILGAGASLSNSAAIVVGSGTTLDASATGFGFNLNSAVNQVLAGSGTVTGIVTTATGTKVTPGTNGVFGTLTLNNDLNLSGGTYYFDVATTNHDLLVVGGALNNNAGTLVINPVNTLTNGVYKLIQYAGSEGGSLGNLTLSGGQAGKIFALSDATSGEIDLTVSSASSDNLTWVGDGSANYWDVGTPNWYDNTLSASGANFSAGDMVTFDDTGSASPNVNIESGAVSPAAVIVTNTVNTYTFNGSKITGGGTTLTKNGSGTLVLANAGNDYGGVTVINGGLLQIGDGSTSSTAIGLGNVTNYSALKFYQPDNSSVVGSIVGTGSLYQLGANSTATLTLLANNTYSGLTTVDTGILQIGNGGLSGSLGANAVVVTNGGQLVIDLAGSVSLANGISGPGALSIAGPGTITLGGANSYQNNTTITNGVVKLGADNAIPSGGITTGWLVLDGGTTAGTLDLNGHNQAVNTLSGLGGTILGQILNNGGSGLNTLTIGTTIQNTTYAGLIENNNNAGAGQIGLNIVGDGTLTYALTLSGLNSYSGPVFINGAKVILGGTLATVGDAAIGTGAITLTNNGTLQMNGLGAVTPTTTFANSILVPAGTTGNLLTGGRTVYSSSITAHGTLNLTTSYVRSEPTGDWSASDGQINIIAGTGGGDVYLATTTGFNFGTAAINLGAGTHIYNSANNGGPINMTIGELTGSGTISDTTAAGPFSRTTIYVVGGRNTDATFSGTIANQARVTGINKVGSGKWTLSGVDSFSASTTVSSGALIIGTATSFMSNSPSITVNAGALLDVSIYGGLTLAGGQTWGGSGVVTGAVAMVDSDMLSPGVSGAGTLSFSNSLTLGSGSGGYAVTNYFDLSSDPTGLSLTNDGVVVAGDLTLTGTNIVVINPLNTILGAGTYTLFKYSGNLYTNGVLCGNDYLPNNLVAAGAFAANSDVTLTFSNANNAVVLIVTPNGQNLTWVGGLTNNWDVNISSNWVNAATALTNFLTYDNVTFTNIATNQTVTLVGTLAPGSVLVNSDSNYVFSGTGKLTGSTSLTKGGIGTLTISDTGGNDYTGTVTISGGVLKAGVATALGATNGATVITNTGALDVGGLSLANEPIVVSGNGGGNGAIQNSGAAQLTALTAVTLAGDTTFGGTNRWDIRTNALGGYLVGNGHNLTKVGINDTYLVNMGNANLNNVTISQGRIGLQNNTALGAGGTLTLVAGAGLDLWDTTVTNTKSVSLTSATISSSSSANVYGGTISLIGTGTFTATTPLVLNGALTNSGGVLKLGASVLTLAGSSTYTGNTTISNGVLALVGTASIANSANLDVTAGGVLDVSGHSGSSLTLGSAQALIGNGTVNGSVSAPAGSIIAPGEGAIGALTVTNILTLAGTTIMEINRLGAPVCDLITATNINYGGTLTVTNINLANPPQLNDSFKLFKGAYAGTFATINLPALGTGLVWTNTLAVNGSITVVAGPTTNPNATNITSVVTGSTLSLSWPGDHLGWFLLTNSVGLTSTNDWHPYAGSDSVTNVNLTIDPTKPNVFFRMAYPYP